MGNAMLDVIQKLKAAIEGSRGLDAEIALHLGWQSYHGEPNPYEGNDYVHAGHWGRPGHPEDERREPKGGFAEPPRYTTSLDAALTLVPEGWAGRVEWGGCYATGKPCLPHAELAQPIQTEFGPGVGIRAQVDGATPALALCIAALKARSS